MNIALVRCPWIPFDNAVDIGFAYLAAAVTQDGHHVTVFDENITCFHDPALPQAIISEYKKSNDCDVIARLGTRLVEMAPSTVRAAAEKILAARPRVVGFNVWQYNGAFSIALAQLLKQLEPSLFVVFGGPDAYPLLSGVSFMRESAVDLVVYGEAEATIRKVLDAYTASNAVPPMPGTITKNNGVVCDNGFGDPVMDIDSIPHPWLEGFPVSLYPRRKIPIMFTRGCRFRCEYCPNGMYPCFRKRSPAGIMSEIRCRLAQYPGMREFFVCDAAFNTDAELMNGLSSLLIEANTGATFTGFGVVNPRIDRALMSRMYQAGVRLLVYGIESGSPRMLARFGKKQDLATIERTLQMTHEAGINAGVDILIGMPGETDDDFDLTIRFLERNRHVVNYVGINTYGKLPYSYLHSHQDEFSFLPDETQVSRLKIAWDTVRNLGLDAKMTREL